MNRLTSPRYLLLPFFLAVAALQGATISVRDHGARGDGKTMDTQAVNAAIEAAAAQGGGTVEFPAGDYLCYSIHLRSHVTLQLDAGATILAADPPPAGQAGGYDAAEPNPTPEYQDFGHTHFHNSLIWGEDVEDVAIVGQGRIYGRGLSRGRGRVAAPVNADVNELHRMAAAARAEEQSAPQPDIKPGPFGYPNARDTLADGIGNKAIALKNCRDVTLRGFTVLHGGHFALLATGVDNFVIDGLRIDTNRDGMDIDSCSDVRISDCTVNSPFDDGICLKASNGLGHPKLCQNITITGCQVTGWDEGTLLSGTHETTNPRSNRTGRIKFGTEATGGFRNVAITNCIFESCQGLALEQVDGAVLEDVVVSNITMRDIGTAPIFIRLGARLRSPGSPQPGQVRRILIDNLNATGVSVRQGILIAGIPGHPIQDVSLSNIRIQYAGGGTADQANNQVDEQIDAYPEPGRFGTLPAWGLYARHVAGLRLNNVQLAVEKPDARPAGHLEDVQGARLVDVVTQTPDNAEPRWTLKATQGIYARGTMGLQDGNVADAQ